MFSIGIRQSYVSGADFLFLILTVPTFSAYQTIQPVFSI